MKLWLVRHAQPMVVPGVCYGASDVPVEPLANAGLAEQLAAALPLNTPPQGMLVLYSPLQRCEHLAQSLCALRPDLPMASEPKLAEMDFGQWELQPWANIPKEALDRWTADFADHRFGGHESVAEFLARVAAVWDATLARKDVKQLVWLTHAGVIRAASLLAQGIRELQSAQDWPIEAPAFGEWLCLDVKA